jgi:hypothetical protein
MSASENAEREGQSKYYLIKPVLLLVFLTATILFGVFYILQTEYQVFDRKQGIDTSKQSDAPPPPPPPPDHPEAPQMDDTPFLEGTTICTQDAMQCPDGSWVGRTGSRCEFVCPKS